MKQLSLVLMTLALGLTLQTWADVPRPQDFTSVSLIELIGNPAKYDGKLVRVYGFLHLEFEGEALYLHREDYERRLFTNSLHVDIDTCKSVRGGPFNDGYVQIEGRFVAAPELGRMEPGFIRDILRCEEFPSNN